MMHACGESKKIEGNKKEMNKRLVWNGTPWKVYSQDIGDKRLEVWNMRLIVALLLHSLSSQ
jgi:hypothetical protein